MNMSKGKSKKENFTEVTNQDPSENNGEIKRRKQKEKEVEEKYRLSILKDKN